MAQPRSMAHSRPPEPGDKYDDDIRRERARCSNVHLPRSSGVIEAAPSWSQKVYPIIDVSHGGQSKHKHTQLTYPVERRDVAIGRKERGAVSAGEYGMRALRIEFIVVCYEDWADMMGPQHGQTDQWSSVWVQG